MTNKYAEMQVNELVEALRSRTVTVLPTGWRDDPDRLCPECDANANRPKCMWEMGGNCPRHDPDAYDESPWITKPDPLASAAADAIERLAHAK